ncbi:MAG: autoinducer 2 ABC transporter substrate-binding protein [Thermotoga sp.]|nr:MAG: autoinducer 2 ABC transporter substrate-binding protein [Thermotogota bacterium]RKX57161.1 MAG: autoinducer 2 ABC transporter substrate-binding protein [Thermotoga sp.]
MRKLILGLLIISILMVSMITFGAEKKYEIAVVVKIAGIPWFNRMAEGVEQAAKDLGVNAYLIGPATADPAPQVQMVEDLVTRGVDAICVVPNDAKALKPVFNKAKEKGIVVLTHESPFETEAIDWDIETIDSVEYGKLAINEIVRLMVENGIQCTEENPCGFVMLVGSLTVPLHNYWADVALEYAKKYFPFLKELTSRLPTAESVEDSRAAVLDLITTYGDKLKAVIGWGSLGPIGAAQAVYEKGLQDKIIVGGSAIPSTAVPYLSTGAMDWAQLWDPKDAGYAMVYIAKQILDGKKIEPGMEIPGLGPINIKGKVIYVNQIKLMRTPEDAEALGF